MKKLLIADDEDDVREIVSGLISSYLNELDIEIFEASSFDTAEELIAEIDFDLIIVDLCLSGARGIDLLKFVRNTAQRNVGRTGIEIAQMVREKNAKTKLIAITGLTDLISEKDSFELFDMVIEKPFDSDFPINVKKILEK